jgi:hypothetical protein
MKVIPDTYSVCVCPLNKISTLLLVKTDKMHHMLNNTDILQLIGLTLSVPVYNNLYSISNSFEPHWHTLHSDILHAV